MLENPSTYASFTNSDIPEWEFLTEMTKRTDCGLLLDVNNVYVSAFNNDFDPVEYIKGLPHERIVQMHLAGHQHCGNYIIDTHDRQVTNEVWKLFNLAYQLVGENSILLEWDGNIPEFDVYHNELLKAEKYMAETMPDFVESQAQTRGESVSNPLNFIPTEIA